MFFMRPFSFRLAKSTLASLLLRALGKGGESDEDTHTHLQNFPLSRPCTLPSPPCSPTRPYTAVCVLCCREAVLYTTLSYPFLYACCLNSYSHFAFSPGRVTDSGERDGEYPEALGRSMFGEPLLQGSQVYPMDGIPENMYISRILYVLMYVCR